jgi:hypothetical protein
MTPDPDMPPSDNWQDMQDFYTMAKTALAGVVLIMAIAAFATGAI